MDNGTLSFSTDLWDQFDIVVERITKGRADLKAFSGYLKDRASIEDTYSRSLKNVADKQNFQTDSTLSKCWTDIRTSASSLAAQHTQFGKMCSNVMSVLDKHCEILKKSKTKLSNAHSRVFKENEKKYKGHLKAKSEYKEGIRKAESTTANLLAGRNNKKLKEKDLSKLEKQVRQAIKPVDELKLNYKKSVEALKISQQQYVAQVATILHEFEEMEVKRLGVLKDQILRYSEGHHWMKNALDQIFVFTQAGLEAISIPKDIQDFIGWSKSNKDPQSPMEYEEIPYEAFDNFQITKDSILKTQPNRSPRNLARAGSKIWSKSLVDDSLLTRKKSPPGPSKRQQITKPPLPIVNKKEELETPKQKEDLKTSKKNRESETSTQKEDLKTSNQKAVGYCTARVDYKGSSPSNLSFKEGERIDLTYCPDTEQWWTGFLADQSGTFPKEYVHAVFVTESITDTVSHHHHHHHHRHHHHQKENVIKHEEDVSLETYEVKVCKAMYDFQGAEDDEISFKKGEMLNVTGTLEAWYIGYTNKDLEKIGIFPSNYVEITE